MKIITGPTGSGKTRVAEKISEKIFSADAYQFYREIPILSNQPEDHHRFQFVADRSIADPTNAGKFSREALPHLNEGVWAGVGLYLGAAIFGLDEERKKGTPFQGESRTFYRMVVLFPDRKELYHMLDERVDQMLKQGAMEEAKKVLSMLESGVVKENNPTLKAIGLNHLLRHLRGEWTFEETLRLWKRDTRRLAKRQITWLKKFCAPSNRCLWVDPKNESTSIIREFLG